MSADLTYLDSSAIVKLVVRERETDALVGFLAGRPDRISCALIKVEVVRAVRPHGWDAVHESREVLRRIHQIAIDDALLDIAAEMGSPLLRSLDALHLAAAWRLAPNVLIVTFDRRLRDAAQVMGLRTVSPGA